MLPGTHVPDGARLLAVPREARRGERVERHPLVAACEGHLADAGPAEHALERPNVEILTGMRAGHDRDLGRLEIERLDPAGLDQRHDPERLDGRAQGHDAVGITDGTDQPAGRVGLDDVASMETLFDAIPNVTDEDGRVRSRSVTGPCPPGPGRALRGKGHVSEHTAHGSPRRVA